MKAKHMMQVGCLRDTLLCFVRSAVLLAVGPRGKAFDPLEKLLLRYP
jgi:hypothetical protein